MRIRESRNLTRLSVPPLSRHQQAFQDEEEADSNDVSKQTDSGPPLGATVDRPSPSSALISYRPPLHRLQERLKTRHALQFAVEYDVDRSGDMEGRGGEVQVGKRVNHIGQRVAISYSSRNDYNKSNEKGRCSTKNVFNDGIISHVSYMI